MRATGLINKGSPCDIDFTDKTMQTVSDFKSRQSFPCTNLAQCRIRSEREGITCYRTIAMEMARFILQNKKPFEQAVKEEREGFLGDDLNGKFWVYRDGQWQVVKGKKNLVNDIVDFARTIIDFQPGDRRPFTKDGVRPIEFGPGDAVHNAMLDLDDVYGEVGQGNPFRR